MTAGSASQPPTACTTIEPAKSWNSWPVTEAIQAWMPKALFQAMPSYSGYTTPTITAVAMSCGQNLARSAMPPEMMAGMAAAKVSKKKNFTSS